MKWSSIALSWTRNERINCTYVYNLLIVVCYLCKCNILTKLSQVKTKSRQMTKWRWLSYFKCLLTGRSKKKTCKKSFNVTKSNDQEETSSKDMAYSSFWLSIWRWEQLIKNKQPMSMMVFSHHQYQWHSRWSIVGRVYFRMLLWSVIEYKI